MSETINVNTNEEPIVELIGIETEEVEIEVDGVIYIEKSTYRVYSDESKVFACSSRQPKVTEDVVPAPSQLDIIEANTSYIMMMMEV